MMDMSMDSMMTWMMGIGMLGWVLLIALLATFVVLVISRGSTPGDSSEIERQRRQDKPLQQR